MVSASIREHAEHCDFFASTSFASLRATQKFGEHEQASTRLNFASKSQFPTNMEFYITNIYALSWQWNPQAERYKILAFPRINIKLT